MLTAFSAYAVRALALLAVQPGKWVRIATLAEELRLPRPTLAKILHYLGRKGLVETQRGRGGGVRLTRDPASISMYEVLEMVDEPFLKSICLLGFPECGYENPCALHTFWDNIKQTIFDHLRRTTLADIAAVHHAGSVTNEEAERQWRAFAQNSELRGRDAR